MPLSSITLIVCGLAIVPVWRPASAPRPRTSPSVARDSALAATESSASATARGVSSRAELEAFLDGVMIANLRREHVAGATVSVVKDGALFFAKGYGFADVAEQKPVDAEKTLFRIGSISKLFTWTAVMQLVEAGKLSLDADMNTYLDFEIPKTYSEPITLRHVMTHTAGFEEDGRDLFTYDPQRIEPLGRWLATHVPGRVRPPGIYASYSNYASALAGYVVERVSGMPWADYIEQRVLAPLGMEQTCVRQPLPPRYEPDMSLGYDFEDGRFAVQKWEIVTGAAPAGSLSSSAADMAKFMLAHLGKGANGGRRILNETTAELMHARAFGHDERLNGSALGFYEKSSHGLRIIGHNGDTAWFHCDLFLIPAERIGVFVSYNSSGGRVLSRFTFLGQFLDHYYAPAPLPIDTSPDARAELERVSGEYAFMRHSYTTFQKVDGLTGAIRVEPTESGKLLLNAPFGTNELVRVGPMLYRDALSETLFAFKGDSTSPATHLFMGDLPPMALERVPWSESRSLHWFVLGTAIITFAATIICALRRAWRKRFGTPRASDALPGRGRLLAAVLCFLAFVMALLVLVSDPMELVTSPMIALKIVLVLPVVGAALTLGAVYSALSQWRTNAGTRGARLRYTGTVAMAVVFIWSLNVWNLLGWRT